MSFIRSRRFLVAGGILLAVSAVILYAGMSFRFYTLPHNGMFPAYDAGQRLLIHRHSYRDIGEVARGDVVLFRHKERDGERIYLWRVVGLPGDLVELQGNELRVNEKPLDYRTLRTEGAYSLVQEKNGEAAYAVAFDRHAARVSLGSARIYMQADEFFLMGDNRLHARDSRFIGPVKFEAIRGKVR